MKRGIERFDMYLHVYTWVICKKKCFNISNFLPRSPNLSIWQRVEAPIFYIYKKASLIRRGGTDQVGEGGEGHKGAIQSKKKEWNNGKISIHFSSYFVQLPKTNDILLALLTPITSPNEDKLQMQCSLDSGLVVVVFIVVCLLWVVCLLLFYEFEDICDKIKLKSNESNMVSMAG